MAALFRILRQLPLVVLSPVLVLLPAILLMVTDVVWKVVGRRRPARNDAPRRQAASAVIPNWNGRDLLEKYLPPLMEAMGGNPDNEIIVVDNGSTDGSAEMMRERFPEVRVLALPKNLGFGGGSNAGFRAAKNDIVVLLNSDMRVAPDFLQPLLDGFDGPDVFAVSCQIFSGRSTRAFTGAGGRALSTGGSFSSWAASTRSCGRSTWRTRTLDTGHGSGAGGCCTNRRAACGTSTGARSGRSFRGRTSTTSSARISFFLSGKTSTSRDDCWGISGICGRAGC